MDIGHETLCDAVRIVVTVYLEPGVVSIFCTTARTTVVDSKLLQHMCVLTGFSQAVIAVCTVSQQLYA
jgi:hypothetical protein